MKTLEDWLDLYGCEEEFGKITDFYKIKLSSQFLVSKDFCELSPAIAKEEIKCRLGAMRKDLNQMIDLALEELNKTERV